MIGICVDSADARVGIDQIVAAERAGIPIAWAISGRGPDLMPIYAAAAVLTERIHLGTAIIRTWTRHPIGFVQEAVSFEQIAPGRLWLGIGPTGRQAVEQMYGGRYDKPVTHLIEYLTTIRALLHEGKVDFAGEFVTVRHEIPDPPKTPVLAAAAGPRAFRVAGGLSDGAISWVAPLRYLTEIALPNLRRGAAEAGRPPPPIVAHLPVAVTPDRAAARDLARHHLARYVGSPHFGRTWALAGHDPAAGLTDELLDDLLVSGTETEVVAGIRRWRAAGMEQILAHPMVDPADPAGSRARAAAAIARAGRSDCIAPIDPVAARVIAPRAPRRDPPPR